MEVFESTLAQMELEASVEMEEGNFAAYDWDDGYYIFKIVGEPYPLENPRGRKPVKVEGCNEVPDGTMVCKGIYWNPVPDAKGWYTPPPGGNRAKKHIFRVQYVLHPKVTMQDPTDEIALPKRYGGKKKEQVMAMGPKQILPKHHDMIEHEKYWKDMMDFVEEDMPNEAAETRAAAVARAAAAEDEEND